MLSCSLQGDEVQFISKVLVSAPVILVAREKQGAAKERKQTNGLV